VRSDDLPLLLDYYLRRFNRELRRGVHGISPDALETLLRYSWPGNVRELQSELKQALLHAHGPVLTFDCLPHGLRAAVDRTESIGPPSLVNESLPLVGLDELIRRRLSEGSTNLFEEVLSVAERHLLSRVLEH